MEKNFFRSVILAVFLFSTIHLVFSRAEKFEVYPLKTGDTAFQQVSSTQRDCGDLKNLKLELDGKTLQTVLEYCDQPFGEGALSLNIDLSYTLFGNSSITQHPLKIQFKSSGEILKSPVKGLVIKETVIDGKELRIFLILPEACRKIGLSGSSKLIWEKGWVSDEIEYVKYKPATGKATPPKTPEKRVLSRENYKVMAGNFVDRGDDNDKAATLFEQAKSKAIQDPFYAHRDAEQAYQLTSQYTLKSEIISFLKALKNPVFSEMDEEEKKRSCEMLGMEHYRYLSEIPVAGYPARILKMELLMELSSAYGMKYTGRTTAEMKIEYGESLKSKSYEEINKYRGTDDPLPIYRLAQSAFKKGEFELAYRAYYEYLRFLSAGLEGTFKEKAEDGMVKSLEKAAQNVTNDDRKALTGAKNHIAFSELSYVTSHHFVLMGPEKFLSRVSQSSIAELDAAWLIQSDLLGTPEENRKSRIVMFFRELYGVGGGQGGSDRIFISLKYTKNSIKATELGSHLYFHELTHCLAPPFPIWGLNEGIADLGALISLQLLNKPEAKDLQKSARKSFETYFTRAGIRFEDIPTYDPSCGFFLIPQTSVNLENYAYWEAMRAVFWDMGHYPIRSHNTMQWLRHYVKLLEIHFGDWVYSECAKAGIDVSEEDKFILQDEINLYAHEIDYHRFRGWQTLERYADTIASENQASYFRTIALFDALNGAIDAEDHASIARLKGKLGIPVRMFFYGARKKALRETGYASGVAGALSSFTPGEFWGTSPQEVPEEMANVESKEVISSDKEGFFELGQKENGILACYTDNLLAPFDGIIWTNSSLPFRIWLDDKLLHCSPTASRSVGKYDTQAYPIRIPAGVHRIAISLPYASVGKIRIRLTNKRGYSELLATCTPNKPSVFSILRPPVVLGGESLFLDTFSKWRSASWNPIQTIPTIVNDKLGFKKGYARLFRFRGTSAEGYDSKLGLFWHKKEFRTDQYSVAATFTPANAGKETMQAAIILDGTGDDELVSGLSFHFERTGNKVSLSVLRWESPIISLATTLSSPEMNVKVFRYSEWVWVEMNGNTFLPAMRVEGVAKGMLGVGFSDSLLLDEVRVDHLSKE